MAKVGGSKMTRNILRRQNRDGTLLYDGDTGECVLKVYNYPGAEKWLDPLSEVLEAAGRGYAAAEVAAEIRAMWGGPLCPACASAKRGEEE